VSIIVIVRLIVVQRVDREFGAGGHPFLKEDTKTMKISIPPRDTSPHHDNTAKASRR